MREQERARGAGFSHGLQRGGIAARMLAAPELDAALARIEACTTSLRPAQLSSVGGTTHVSVIDRQGNAASLSTSTGSGSGVVVPGTGIYLNNMLGEYDLVADGSVPAGRRLSSMMAPTIALDPRGGPPGRAGRGGGGGAGGGGRRARGQVA